MPDAHRHPLTILFININPRQYYTTVTVEDGDTLWTLADAYMDDQYQNKREFIAEVKQLNQIDENRIHEGTQLVIPYYSAEYL